MSKTFLIIDGSSMLSTAYYGTLPRAIMFAKTQEEKEALYHKILQTSDGKYTNGMYTMLVTLFNLINRIKPNYMAIAFDMSRNTFRRTELGADFYKSNRKDTPSPLKNQFKQIEDLLEHTGFPVFYGPDFEADDYVASIVSQFENNTDINILIHTKDHDFMQLVRDNVNLIRPVNESKIKELNNITSDFRMFNEKTLYYDPKLVKLETGVTPEEITDLLAIQGDIGDSIPGCKGVSTAASQLIAHYHTIEALYDAIHETQNDKKIEKDLVTFWKNELQIKRNPLNALKTSENMVILSKKLATMKRDIPGISSDINDYIVNINKYKLWEELNNYEMKSLLDSIDELAESLNHE